MNAPFYGVWRFSRVIDKDLLDILVCPSCREPVKLTESDAGDDAQARLVCSGCGLRYPVKDDIPIMLIEEAQSAKPDRASE